MASAHWRVCSSRGAGRKWGPRFIFGQLRLSPLAEQRSAGMASTTSRPDFIASDHSCRRRFVHAFFNGHSDRAEPSQWQTGQYALTRRRKQQRGRAHLSEQPGADHYAACLAGIWGPKFEIESSQEIELAVFLRPWWESRSEPISRKDAKAQSFRKDGLKMSN